MNILCLIWNYTSIIKFISYLMIKEGAFMANGFITSQPHDICPNKLYKYIGNIEYALEAVENETIYFPLSDTFNDPFDSKIVNNGFILDLDSSGDKYVVMGIINKILFESNNLFIYFFKDEKNYKDMENSFLQMLGDKEIIAPREYLQFVYEYFEYDGSFFDFYECVKQTYIEKQPIVSLCHRVTCFSEKNDSIIMWSYYADNHKGVCLEYTPSLLNDMEIYNSIQKVNYNRIQKNIVSNCIDTDYVNMMYFNKASCWKHEKEWRIVLKENVERLYFPCLTGIYLGVNFRDEHNGDEKFIRIINAIQNSKNKIGLYEAVPDNNMYKLNFRCIIPVTGV